VRPDDDAKLELAADLPDPRVVKLQLKSEILSRDVSGEFVVLAHAGSLPPAGAVASRITSKPGPRPAA